MWPKYGFVAALLTRMSRRPCRARICSKILRMSSTRPTWHGCASALPPASLISRATDSQSSSLRLDTITWAPCSASSLAISSPIPRLAPVTRAIFPFRSNKSVVTITSNIYVPVSCLCSDQVNAHLRKHPSHLPHLSRLFIRRVTAQGPLLHALCDSGEPEETERHVKVPVLNRRNAP